MTKQIEGIHHVTAIARDPQANVDFYAGVLGLRLVKKTVNFDDPGTYHFYDGDEAGTPGTILTFFPWPLAKRGTQGAGQTTATAFSVPEGSLGWWAERLESLEDTLLRIQTKRQLAQISSLRRDVSKMRRAIQPVRELVAHFVRSDSPLLDERTDKYFRDVLDHSIQAYDFVESQRDMLMNLQDLYMNQINLKMNEVMKMFTLLATLMAPATVIGGIFGMNFDVIPLAHQEAGFWFAVGGMLLIPLGMILWFRSRKWF